MFSYQFSLKIFANITCDFFDINNIIPSNPTLLRFVLFNLNIYLIYFITYFYLIPLWLENIF